MAILNQFQIYSQGENTVTNNVLLMMSSLYEIRPKYYEDFIRGLIEDENQYGVLPTFKQQIGNRGDGVIDGYIEVKPSKIIIETKLRGLEWKDKLVKYCKSFESYETKILFHVSDSKYTYQEIADINQRIAKDEGNGKITFQSVTYEDLVNQLKFLAEIYSYEYYLIRLYEHFKSYCISMNLLPQSNTMLRAMACGHSFDLNIKHRFYFDLAERGFTPFKYLGIYRWKAVKLIGLIENEIVADWSEECGLNIKQSRYPVNEEQKIRLIDAIKDSMEEGWDINFDHRFFLMSETFETDYRKTSPGGIFRVRYFNLEDIFDKVPGKLSNIAEQLRAKTWE